MRKALLFIIAILFFLAPLWGRALYDARRNLELARISRSEDKFIQAIEYYRRAISWRTVLNSDAYLAAAELHLMVSEQIEDAALKLDGLRELRSGYLGSRSFLDHLPPLSSEETEARRIVLKLDSEIEALIPPDQKGEPHLISGSFYQPNLPFQILSQIAFWGWIISIFFIIWRGFSADGNFDRKVTLRYSSLAILFFVSWLLFLKAA